MLKTKIVEGLIGIPKNPMSPAVIKSGSIFGIKEIKIILYDLNIQAINKAINKMARDNEMIKLLIK